MLISAENFAENQTIKQRIMKDRLGLDCVYLELSITNNQWNKTDSKATLKTMLSTFQKETSLLNISIVSEAQPSTSKYVDRLKTLLN